MLVEIYCNKFKNDGRERGPIKFHEGLNVILGDRRAKNSIGKTTFLLAIDYALGGDQYTKGTDDMLLEVGDHDVCFTFKFEGVEYSFKRNTADRSTVWKCDRRYNPTSLMDLADYKDWLGAHYGMSNLGDSFGSLISPFMRIFGMDHSDLSRPFQIYAGEGNEAQLNRLLKLYGLYLPISKLSEECDTLSKSKKAYDSARDFNHISAATNKTEYKENEMKIRRLQEELQDVYDSSGSGSLDVEPEKAEHTSHLKSALKQLRRQRTVLRKRRDAIEDSLSATSFRKTRDFEELQRFFPEINIKSLEEIEQFHAGITHVMKGKYKEEIRGIEDELKLIEDQINIIESEISSLGPISNLSKVVLDRVGELKAELVYLEEANSSYERLIKLREKLAAKKRERDSKAMQALTSVEEKINERLIELNEEAVGGSITAPVIRISSPKSYSFIVPKDGGPAAAAARSAARRPHAPAPAGWTRGIHACPPRWRPRRRRWP